MFKHLKFHHIGVACKDIEKEYENFKSLGYTTDELDFNDPIQKIKGRFIYAQNQPTLELLSNLQDGGPLDSWLKKGVKFYHFAYETNDIEKDFEHFIKQEKAFVITPITEATYFKRICFLMLKNQALIELVEVKNENN